MDMEQLKAMVESLHQKYRKSQDAGYGNLQGLENVIKGQQGVDPSSSTASGYCSGGMPGYAQGGIVDNDFLGQLNSGSVPGLQFDPNSGMPPPPTIAPEAPSLPVQAPNPINSYLDTQKQQLSKFGPEQQLELSNKLVNDRQSFPQKGAVALGGIADALSRVGGGNSNYMGSIQDQQNRLAGEQTSALEKAGTQNLARSESQMKLDQMDPRSPLSQTLQKAWGSLLSQNGFTPEQVAQMPASAIAALTGQSVEQAKAKAEAQLAAASLGLNKQKAGEEVRHNVEQEGIAKAGQTQSAEEKDTARKLEAAKTLSGRGMFKKAADAMFGDPGTKVLEQQLQSSAVPAGRVTVVSPDGTVGHIPKEQLDAAIAKGYKVQ